MLDSSATALVLTIAIPTYKRPAFLEKCIRSVLASVGNANVEILVCDDSIDTTNDAVYASLEEARGLRVLRNATNLGIDANICRCVEQARGRYVWLIGEDDLMRNAGVVTVLDKIAAMPEVPFIFVNYSYITADQSLELRHRSIDEPQAELPFSTFVDDYLWSAGFIGGCVVQREAFLATSYRDFIGTYYAHVAGIVLASSGFTVGLIATPQIGNRTGDAATFTWSEDSFGVFQGWRALLRRLRMTLGDLHFERAYASHRAAHGYLGFKFLVAKRADNLLTPDAVRILATADLSDAERRRVQLVARYFPPALCRLVRWVYAAARRRRLAAFSLT